MLKKKLLDSIKAEMADGCNISHSDVKDLIDHILFADRALKAIASCPDMGCKGCKEVADVLTLSDSTHE